MTDTMYNPERWPVRQPLHRHRSDRRAHREVRLPDDHQRRFPRRRAVPLQERPALHPDRDRRGRVQDRGDAAGVRPAGAGAARLSGDDHARRPSRQEQLSRPGGGGRTRRPGARQRPPPHAAARTSSTPSARTSPPASRSSASAPPATPLPLRDRNAPLPSGAGDLAGVRCRKCWAATTPGITATGRKSRTERCPGAESHPILRGVDLSAARRQRLALQGHAARGIDDAAAHRLDPRPETRAGGLDECTTRRAGPRLLHVARPPGRLREPGVPQAAAQRHLLDAGHCASRSPVRTLHQSGRRGQVTDPFFGLVDPGLYSGWFFEASCLEIVC